MKFSRMANSKSMPDSECREVAGPCPTAWVLAAPGAGDNRQLETLVEVLGADARWIGQIDPISTVLRDRLVGLRARTLPQSKRERYAPPWPDLVLIAGGRGVIDARRIRHASGGKSRVVCLGRPWAPLDWFDLVITTPQYRLPAGDNVITLDLPLNLPPAVGEEDLAWWRGEFDALPRPMLGVLLGGDSGSYRFDAASAERIAKSINELVMRAGGSAVVVGSPRTPTAALGAIEKRLDVPGQVHRWAPQAANPYGALLRLADALLVTGDSASMLAEACRAGKPVALIDLRERARARLNRRFRAITPALARARQSLTSRGLWIPSRDMPALHRRAAESGWLTDPAVLLDGFGQGSAPAQPLDALRERVLALLAGECRSG